jgi:hypothetical protein
MKLFELKIGFGPENTTKNEYWVLFRKDSLYFFPRLSDLVTKDALSALGGKPIGKNEWGDKETTEKFRKIMYDGGHDENKVGWALVNREQKTINLDITKWTGHNNRRPAGKLKNASETHAYPILGGDLGFKRVVDLQKALKALAKVSKEPISNFMVIGDERVKGMTLADVINPKTEIKADYRRLYDSKSAEIELFHGTSMKCWKQIQIQGLVPGARDEVYSDLLKNYSAHNVYLTFSPDSAANYAVREASNDQSDAVIVKITLNRLQFEKLVPDEDNMHWLSTSVSSAHLKKFLRENPLINEIWEGKFEYHINHLNHDDQKFGLAYLFTPPNRIADEESKRWKSRAQEILKSHGLDEGSEKLVEIEKAIYFNLMKCFIDGTRDKSAKKDGTIAYKGRIRPNQIKPEKTWKIPIDKHSSDDYNAAIDAQEKTVTKGK